MPENILPIRCTVLESIVLQMATVMRVLGMRVEDKGLVCTLSETVKLSPDIGKTEFLMFQAHTALSFQFHLLLLTTPKCLMLFRYKFFTYCFLTFSCNEDR